ncbi:ClpXP protease specificity-enhancing factor [Oleiagrimonas soli]|nr:ClpXP protease specificity-enhancing factor [Oleiagrimonas soli]KGI78744.1 peptidase [Oleiagrimonas soli]
MNSNRPYLLRAIYDWVTDNGLTPYVLVDATRAGVQVPSHVIKDGQVVLNIAMRAVANLDLGNDRISFSARFSGVSQSVSFPVSAVLAIYAQENGQGMMFPEDADPPPPDDGSVEPSPASDADGSGDEGDGKPRRGAPHLRVIK